MLAGSVLAGPGIWQHIMPGGCLSSHWLGSRKRGEEGTRDKVHPQEHTHSDLLPPARPHLLKFSLPPKRAPQTGNQAFDTFICKDISYLSHNMI
jgi:hypothetical protein